MDFKTETQYRQEISVVWGMVNQLKAENAALKEQVTQLDFRNERLVLDYSDAQLKITTLQAKAATLVDALNHFALIDLGRDTVPSDFGLNVLSARKAITSLKGE